MGLFNFSLILAIIISVYLFIQPILSRKPSLLMLLAIVIALTTAAIKFYTSIITELLPNVKFDISMNLSSSFMELTIASLSGGLLATAFTNKLKILCSHNIELIEKQKIDIDEELHELSEEKNKIRDEESSLSKKSGRVSLYILKISERKKEKRKLETILSELKRL